MIALLQYAHTLSAHTKATPAVTEAARRVIVESCPRATRAAWLTLADTADAAGIAFLPDGLRERVAFTFRYHD
jgi:hypothetical protein